MVNPLLTLIVDVILVGTAIAVIATMVQEYLDSRVPAVGTRHRAIERRTPAPSAKVSRLRHRGVTRRAA